MSIRASRHLVALWAIGLTACGGGGGGSSSNDWYYHWSCNGDPQCLADNPGAVGQASGTVGPEPGGQAGCNSLMTFGTKFWNIPPASQSCDHSPSMPAPVVVSLTIEPANSTMPLGQTRPFTATGHLSDGTTRDLTGQVTWGTSATAIGSTPVATVSASGLVTASALGSITIIADYGALRATTGLNVGAATVASIVVTPPNANLPKGATLQFTATGHYSDGTTADLTAKVNWQSSPASVATFAPGGLATGAGVGTSTITAGFGSISGSTTLTVGPAALAAISVTPPDPRLARTFTRPLRALGIYTDGTAQDLTGQVAWSSGTATVATVDAAGLVTGVSAGASVIKAAAGAVSGTTTLTVTSSTLTSVTVTPPTPSIAPASTLQFRATGGFSDGSTLPLPGAAWSSDTAATAIIGAGGLASAVAVGTSTVTASLGAASGNTLLTVTTTPPGEGWAYLASSPAVTCNACGAASTTLASVVWSGTQLVAVALSGAVVTSPDGLTWTTRVAGASYGIPNYGPLMSVAWAAPLGRFVAVGGGYVSTSPDGVTWTPNTTGPFTADNLFGVVWSGSQFVAVGYAYGTYTPAIVTSPDGLSWTAWPVSGAGILRGVAWNGAFFVAVGDGTLVSADGAHWATVADTSTRWNAITWTGSRFVAVGDVAGATGKIRTSPDGLTWTDQAAQPAPLYGVAWTGMQVIATGGTGGQAAYGLNGVLGSPGFLATSPDGVTWTARAISAVGIPSGTIYTIYGAAWTGTRLVAVGEGVTTYQVYTSP